MSQIDIPDNSSYVLEGSGYQVAFVNNPENEDLEVTLTFPDGEVYNTDYDLGGEYQGSLDELLVEFAAWDGDIIGFLAYWGVIYTLAIEDRQVQFDGVSEDHTADLTIEGFGEFTFTPSEEIPTISDLVTTLRSNGLKDLSSIKELVANEG